MAGMTDMRVEAAARLTDKVAMEIRLELTRQRMSQAKLARALGKSQMWLSDRLRGVQPFDLIEIEEVAEVLDVPAVRLLYPEFRQNRDSGVIPERPIRKRIVRTPDRRPIDRGPRSPSAVRPISSIPATKRRPGPVRPMANAS